MLICVASGQNSVKLIVNFSWIQWLWRMDDNMLNTFSAAAAINTILMWVWLLMLMLLLLCLDGCPFEWVSVCMFSKTLNARHCECECECVWVCIIVNCLYFVRGVMPIDDFCDHITYNLSLRLAYRRALELYFLYRYIFLSSLIQLNQ